MSRIVLACVVSFLFTIRQLTMVQTIKKLGVGVGGVDEKVCILLKVPKIRMAKWKRVIRL